MNREPLTKEQCQKLIELGAERLGAMCLDVDGDCPMYDLFKQDCVFPGMPCHDATAPVWEALLRGIKLGL